MSASMIDMNYEEENSNLADGCPRKLNSGYGIDIVSDKL